MQIILFSSINSEDNTANQSKYRKINIKNKTFTNRNYKRVKKGYFLV